MALRDYMQDLLRSQTSGDDDCEENGTVKIIIVDDNSSSSLPEDHMEESENGSMSNLSFARRHSDGLVHSEGVDCDHGYLRIDWVGEQPQDSREDTNRTMLDDFRRRQRYLRETLSPNPKRASVRMATAGSPIKFSPSPIITQWTPPTFHRDSEEQIPRDSQRDRMRRLKASLRIQQNGSPLLI